MTLRNTENTFGKMSIVLHWLMAAMIVGLISVGFYMDGMEKGPDKTAIVQLHKATGFIVLLLALFRWYWVISNESPKPLEGTSKAEIGLAHASKWLLLLLMLIMPLSGVLMSMSAGYGISIYGIFEVPALLEKNRELAGTFNSIHKLSAYALVAVIVLHLLGAINHHFIKKDATLNRMLGK